VPAKDPPVARIARHAREIRESGEAAAGAGGLLVADVADLAQRELEARPYFTVGLAFGAGLLLGGGLPPRVVTGAAGLGLRLAVARAVRRVLEEAGR